MLLVDRSGSMKADFGGEGARWNVLREALIDPVNGLVTSLEGEVRFGLTLYTGEPSPRFPGFPGGGQGGRGGGGASAGGVNAGDPSVCPWLIEVPVALDNRALISSVYKSDDWQGATPTGEALAEIWPKVRDIDQTLMPGPNYIILATDGEPNACGDFMADGRPRVLDEVAAAHAAGVTTYVISVGEGVGRDHLKQVANRGQGRPVDSPDDLFYVVGDTQQLTDSLQQIIAGLRACEFELAGTVDLEEADRGSVVINGSPFPYEQPNGWELVTDRHLKLNGEACDLIQNGATQINIEFPCGVFVSD
jgi:hypothetical protein